MIGGVGRGPQSFSGQQVLLKQINRSQETTLNIILGKTGGKLSLIGDIFHSSAMPVSLVDLQFNDLFLISLDFHLFINLVKQGLLKARRDVINQWP